MEKINLVELLKDCPSGMELDCVMYDNLYFDKVVEDFRYPIGCYTIYDGCRTSVNFTEFGEFNNYGTAKCVIFPKDRTTWEGFHRPFKDGDIVVNASNEDSNAFVYAGEGDDYYECYVGLTTGTDPELYTDKSLAWVSKKSGIRLATEEEKERLFQAIKENGYKWNAETKTLEELIIPKFKIGDRIKSTYNTNQYVIKGITDTHYTLVEVKEKFKYTEPIINDKDWDLVPNKFDINTLKPFDKVLIRDNGAQMWSISFFSHCNGLEAFKFSCINGNLGFEQCIPYEGNERLLGTYDDCDEYFKNWK